MALLAIRFLGHVPDGAAVPPVALGYVAEQLGVAPAALAGYGRRTHTRSDHVRDAMAVLGFRRMTPADRERLGSWAVARAMEHDRPIVLVGMACDWLRGNVSCGRRCVSSNGWWPAPGSGLGDHRGAPGAGGRDRYS